MEIIRSLEASLIAGVAAALARVRRRLACWSN